MRRAISTHMFVRQRLSTHTLEAIARAGFSWVEIFCARQHMDYLSRNQILDVAAWFAGAPVKLLSLHLPMYRDEVWGKSGPHARISIAEADKVRRVEAVDELKRALEIADELPFTYAILHIGHSGEMYDERKIDAAMWSIEHLRLFARQRGVSLLLENTPNDLSRPEFLTAIITELRFPDLGICFDSGHAHMGEGVLSAWEKAKRFVRSTHLHDNHRDKDDHLFPFEGAIDWKAFTPALCAAGPDLPWLFEIHDPCNAANPLQEAGRVFDRLESLAAQAHAT
jgi:sugar phosphate isomerase/epimerase